MKINTRDELIAKQKEYAASLNSQRKQILIMFLRKQQRMSSGCRSQIQNHSEILILIQGSGGNLSICNFTKNTVTILHPKHRL